MFEFINEVKVSDVLTTVTILISATALLVSWSKDRQLKIKSQSDQIRSAIANTLVGMERWQTIFLSFFQEIQPTFIETSELLEGNKNILATRDHLWKRVTETKAKIDNRLVDEKIEMAYTSLFAYFPEIRDPFLNTISYLKEADNEYYRLFLEISQKAIFSFENRLEGYTSAQLGNELRKVSNACTLEYTKKSNSLLAEQRSLLLPHYSKKDKELLKRNFDINAAGSIKKSS